MSYYRIVETRRCFFRPKLNSLSKTCPSMSMRFFVARTGLHERARRLKTSPDMPVSRKLESIRQHWEHADNKTIQLTLQFPRMQKCTRAIKTTISTTRFKKFITISDIRGETRQRCEQSCSNSSNFKQRLGANSVPTYVSILFARAHTLCPGPVPNPWLDPKVRGILKTPEMEHRIIGRSRKQENQHDRGNPKVV